MITAFTKPETKKYILLTSVIALLFWCYAKFFNIYQFVITGIVFELAWLPIVILTLVLPVFTLMQLYYNKFKFDVYISIALLIQIVMLYLLITK